MQKDQITNTLNNMNEPQTHHAAWKKPDGKGYILYDSMCSGNIQEKQNRSVVAKGVAQGAGLPTREHEGTF